MQYNAPSEKEQIQERPLDDYFDGSEHSHFKRRSFGRSEGKRFSRGDLPLIIIGVVVLILVVFLITTALRSSSTEGDVRLADLEERVKKLEEQLLQVGNVRDQMNSIELQDKKLTQLIDRVSQLESEQDLKWTQVEKKTEPAKPKPKLEAPLAADTPQPKTEPEPAQKPAPSQPKDKPVLAQKPVTAAPQKPAAAAPQKSVTAPKPPAQAKNESPAAKKAPDMHEVKAGDTVFSIAKRYGMKVAVLQQMNPVIKENRIVPGQKLRVKAQ